LVAAVHRHVVDHELAFSDEVVVIDSDLLTEIVDDRREDLFPTLSALRTCGVVHQAFGDKFVDDVLWWCRLASSQVAKVRSKWQYPASGRSVVWVVGCDEYVPCKPNPRCVRVGSTRMRCPRGATGYERRPTRSLLTVLRPEM
jgi:hypothetical protein